MSSITPPASTHGEFVEVAISPAARDALYDLACGFGGPGLEEMERAFMDTDRKLAFRLIDRASAMLRLLDALGWDNKADGPVMIRVDAVMVRFLRDILDYHKESAYFDFSGETPALVLCDDSDTACAACHGLLEAAKNAADEDPGLWVIGRYFDPDAPSRKRGTA